MNILIFSWRGPGHPFAGGAEQSSHEHAVGWVKAGNKVTLFTSFFEGAKDEENIDGVHIIRRGSQIFGVHLRAFFWYLFSEHPEFDVVIDEIHGIPFFTPLYVKAQKLVFIHEVAKEVWKLNPWPRPFNLIPAVVGTLFEPLIFKLVYRQIPFMTVSQSTKSDLMEWGIPGENITIVHNGVNLPSILENSSKEDKKTLIFLGALAKDKGIEDALEIVSILNTFDSSFQFWVVGKTDSGYLENLKKKAQDLKIDAKTKFWGFVSEDKKYKLLAKAHLLICPSIREGWGLVVIEAAAMSTPSVGFDVAGLKDSIKNNETGLLLGNRNSKEMADKILGLLSDEKRYNQMCQEAKIWSKNFSWKKSTLESLKLIQDLVTTHA